MKKIAFFHNVPVGGAKRVLYEQITFLKKNYEVDVYELNSIQENVFNLQSLANHFFSYPFPLSSRTHGFRKRLRADYQNFITLDILHKKIARDIDVKQYDFVVIHPDRYTQAPFLLKYLKTNHVYYCHELLRIGYEDQFAVQELPSPFHFLYETTTRLIRKRIDKKNAQAARHIFCNSQFTAQNVFEAYGRESDVVYPGVDTEIFKPKDTQKIYDILFIGEKNSFDGYDVLEHSLSQLNKSIKVHIIDKAKKSKWVSDEDLANEYSKTKMLVALSKNEPFGLIPLEAMSCGIPVIALDGGGYRETVINNKTGYLVPGDSKKVTEKVQYLLSHPQTLKQFGMNGRAAAVKNWDVEKRNKKFEKEIIKLL